ncbi:MAG: hypothetical protein K8S25_01480, partial [Alphaproteobacteria bacterium]|nr:hypothetical protein [Alphaproteobacteria bacterium]
MSAMIKIPKLSVSVPTYRLPQIDINDDPYAPLVDKVDKLYDAVRVRELRDAQDAEVKAFKEQAERDRKASEAVRKGADDPSDGSDTVGEVAGIMGPDDSADKNVRV